MAQKATKTTGKRSMSSRSMKKATTRAAADAGKGEVAMDRRRKDRRGAETIEAAAVAAPKLERRQKVSRRRQIDPTTCERDYTEQEVEFMNALDDYKRKSGRMFPTCSEVLEVIRSLGYAKQLPAHTSGCAAPIISATATPSVVPAWVGYESVAEVVS
ncbi:MAG: hypothetical protein IT427_17255 [Pirellulales bacterium]|nr:hypothetical protein [Pirellulales bacterium]